MGDRDLRYKIFGLIELDDAYIGGNKSENGVGMRMEKYQLSSLVKAGKNHLDLLLCKQLIG